MKKKFLAIFITCLIVTMTFGVSAVTATEVTLPEAYVDFNFSGGYVTDIKGNASVSLMGNATVGLTEVSVGKKTVTMNALKITEGGQYVLCTLKGLTSSSAVKSWAERGFSVEAFYVMNIKSDKQGVICGTETAGTAGNGGWGIAEDTGKPYFITGASGTTYLNGPAATVPTSTKDLVHVVAVYDYANKKQQLYINGVPLSAKDITSGFNPAGAEAFNKFCLGADYKEIAKQSETTKVDFATPAMTMVDAKIYSTALTAEQITMTYQNALATLDNPNSVYVDFDFTDGKITDVMGNATATLMGGATVGSADVKAGDKSATLDALKITAKNQYALCEFTSFATAEAYEAWASKGFSIEAYYVMSNKGNIQSVICSSESKPGCHGGWTVDEMGGKVSFVTGTAENYFMTPFEETATSATDLVHVVAVYNINGKKQVLYINGVAVASATLDKNFKAPDTGIFNQFFIGAGFNSDATELMPVSNPAANMTMVDAKIYSTALSAEQIAYEYNKSSSVLTDKYEKFEANILPASKLKVDSANDFITGITLGSTVENVLSEFAAPANIKITDKNDTALTLSDIITTGTKISLMSGENTIATLTAVVKGDVSGDGVSNTIDVILARLIIKNLVTLENAYSNAADVTGSIGVNTADIIKLRLFSKGIITAFTESTVFDKDNIVFSFAALSDLHTDGSTTDTAAAKVKKAFEQLKAQALIDDKDGLDAVFAAGDVIDGARYKGAYGEMTAFKALYDEAFDVKNVPFIYASGNHDLNWGSNPVASLKVLDEQLGADYFLYDVDKDATSSDGNRHAVINGYHVITLMPASEYPIVYTDATKAWLVKTLDEIVAENPNQYIFILNHPMIYGTTYGSDLYTTASLGWYTTDLTSILNNYNQVVTFGGHVHFPLNDPRSIMQTAFTSLGCGSVNYMAIEAGGYENMAGTTTMNDKTQFSQGLLVQLDKNGNMRVTRMDFYNEDVIGDELTASYPVNDDSHLDKYSNKRANANSEPHLSTASVTLKNVSGSTQLADVTFASGTDDEFVHHYIVTVALKDGAALKVYNILSDFYKHPDASDMKSEWKLTGVVLPVNSTCTISIVAVDSWGAESAALVKEVVTAKVVSP